MRRQGAITDESAKVVPNALISAKNTATGQTAETRSDPSGRYSIPNLQPGEYEITISAAGYGAKTVTNRWGRLEPASAKAKRSEPRSASRSREAGKLKPAPPRSGCVQGNEIRIVGTIPATLTDFKIDPPSLMMMPVKNEIPVRVETTWHRENAEQTSRTENPPRQD